MRHNGFYITEEPLRQRIDSGRLFGKTQNHYVIDKLSSRFEKRYLWFCSGIGDFGVMEFNLAFAKKLPT
jgi:hypothetical protein